jgi:hypothetical protein
MSEGELNLSGAWDGVFCYPDVPEAGPTTPFLANVEDRGGVLSGTVIEPHEIHQATVTASILGQRIGASVHFTKDYRSPDDLYRKTVFYFGSIAQGGETITGEWHIEEHWRGPFQMTRSTSHEATDGRLAEERLLFFLSFGAGGDPAADDDEHCDRYPDPWRAKREPGEADPGKKRPDRGDFRSP